MSAVELSINLQGIDLQQFDVLEIWRSRELPSGPYEVLTTAGNTPARLPIGAADPPTSPQNGPYVNATGKTLELLLGEEALICTITGTDPLYSGQIALQITAQALGKLRAYVNGATLAIETEEVGGGARLEATGGDLAALIDLPLNTPAFGHEAYLPLIAGVTQYHFTDQQGSTAYFYKVRLRNRLLNQVSEFSEPLSPLSTPEVTDTAIGFVDLTDMDGSAMEGREVRLYSRFNGRLSNGRVVAGFSKTALTDTNGHIEFVLVRGLPITVAIAGTLLVRDLVVPTDPTVTIFNLLDPALGSNDVFKVQIPDIPYATRRSS